MAQTNPRLTRRTVVLVKMQPTPTVDPVPGVADALLVSAPDFSVDVTELARDFVHGDLSQIGYRTGRKLAHVKFELEVRGNGNENSGTIGNAPIWGRLLRACGMSETAINAAATPGAVRDMVTNGGSSIAATWAIANTNSGTSYNDYLVTCILGGASATAKFRVDELNGYDSATNLYNENINITTTSALGTLAVAGIPTAPTITLGGTYASGDVFNFNVHGFVGSYTAASATTSVVATGLAAAINALSSLLNFAAVSAVITGAYTGAAAGVVVTSGTTALTLGSTGVTITPTWSGTMDLGHQWKVSVSPTGIQYQPVSTGNEACTIYMYMDGYLHKVTDCQGTYSMAGTAGQYAKFTFEFTGQYIAPIDATFPTLSIATSPGVALNPVPPTFQLALLRLYSENVTISAFSYAHANTVVPRDDANSADGYTGVRITDRKPEGGIDPEATLVGDFDFWTRLANSDYMQFSCRFGTVAGNTIWIKGPNVQSTKTTYKDRQGLRVYDMGLGFARESGDDEVKILFA